MGIWKKLHCDGLARKLRLAGTILPFAVTGADPCQRQHPIAKASAPLKQWMRAVFADPSGHRLALQLSLLDPVE